jgi:hypothetical protein
MVHVNIENPAKIICTSTPGLKVARKPFEMCWYLADRKCSAVAVDNLDAAAEVEGEVEASSAGYGDLFVEVEETSGGLGEWLDASVAAEVELQTDRREASGVDALARLSDHET